MITKAVSSKIRDARDDVKALLTVSKGSRFVPLMLLVAAALAFIVYGVAGTGSRQALTERFKMACESVRQAADLIALESARAPVDPNAPRLPEGMVPGPVDPKKLTPLEKARKQLGLYTEQGKREFPPVAAKCAIANGPKIDDLVVEFGKTNLVTSNQMHKFERDEVGGWQGVGIVAAAAIKAYLDAFWAALLLYWKSTLLSIATIALFAVIPGFAGLVYRRAFWTWFGVAFTGLVIINAISTSLGRLAAPKTVDPELQLVDAAADLSIFVLAQVAVLLLAFRLKRHTSRMPLISKVVAPKTFNRILFWALVALAAEMIFNVLGTKPFWTRLLALVPFDQDLVFLNVLFLGLAFLYGLLSVSETWTGKRQKNIVICLDGTSNTPDQLDLGQLAQTNVFKLFQMLKADKPGAFAPSGRFNSTLCKIHGDRQIGFYYTGIGNTFDNDPLIGTLAQATGMGATGIIERAYLDLMRVWRPGDRVYIVGFSRGAASARILARVIAARGAPNSIWTLRLFGRHWNLLPSRQKQSVPIEVLGCWDTVGSFGIAKTIAGINFQQLTLFHDLSVPDNVVKAYHMVALDEDRQEFEPTLMEPDPIRPERIVEVWFPGTHAGVGGGFSTDRLSDVPLDFLLRHVSSGYCADGTTAPGDESWGLYLSAVNGMNEEAVKRWTEGVYKLHPDPRGQLRVWISSIYNYRPRTLPLHAVISETVFERMKTSEPVYAPQSLFVLNDSLEEKRNLIAAKVKNLEDTKSMDEAERQAVLDYTDKMRLTRWPSYWAKIADAHRPAPPSQTLANA